MKKLKIGILLVIIIYGIFFSVKNLANNIKIVSPIPKEKPLDRYAFINLKKSEFEISPIILGSILDEEENNISQLFYFNMKSAIIANDKAKKISGLMNVPKEKGVYPVVVMLRGFVSAEAYSTGIGTKRAGEIFARNGFITLAPDFLGYGESDNPQGGSMEERFQTYTTVLALLSSLDNLNDGLNASYSGKIKADVSKVGLWGHSNGGQIAISILEITGENYPTVLWAPVSKQFPYSILYFTDEFDDNGKALRKVVADFEDDYDIELYSPGNYYSWINAPIQIHQGTADDAVPLRWSDDFVSDLQKLNKDVEYFIYPGADHNLLPEWNTAVIRSLNFYKENLVN